MKTVYILIASILILILSGSCRQSPTMAQLSEVDTLLNHEQQDSADALMKIIPSSSLTDEERAYYHLLTTRFQYRRFEVPADDHLLDSAISYYNQVHDAEKLADCYYYKGGMVYERGNARDAILYLKKGETIARMFANKTIVHKIYERLSQINRCYKEPDEALRYARLALQVSR